MKHVTAQIKPVQSDRSQAYIGCRPLINLVNCTFLSIYTDSLFFGLGHVKCSRHEQRNSKVIVLWYVHEGQGLLLNSLGFHWCHTCFSKESKTTLISLGTSNPRKAQIWMKATYQKLATKIINHTEIMQTSYLCRCLSSTYCTLPYLKRKEKVKQLNRGNFFNQ